MTLKEQKLKKQKAKWKRDNKDKVNAYNRMRYNTDPVHKKMVKRSIKNWYEKNKAHRAEYMREYWKKKNEKNIK